jgi:hypothetical protein
MDWMRDMTARWVRILSAAGGDRTPLDEAVDQIAAINGPAGITTGIKSTQGTKSIKGKNTGATRKYRLGRRQREQERDTDSAAPAGIPAVTILCRQLIASVVISDAMLDRLCLLAGQTRAQILDEVSSDLPAHLPGQELRALRAELSGHLPRDTGLPAYAGLGSRIEHLLRLAEEQASALIHAAREEAARITAPGATHAPCPRCGYADEGNSGLLRQS